MNNTIKVGDETHFMVTSSPSTSSSQSEENRTTEVNEINEVGAAFKNATKHSLAFIGQEGFKRSCREVYHLNLKEFLEKTISGKFILNSYSKEGQLIRKARSQLAYILISGLMSENRYLYLSYAK